MRTIIRKSLVTVLAAVMVGQLWGCSNSNSSTANSATGSNPSSTANSSTASGEVTIVYSTGQDSQNKLEQTLVDKFNQENKGKIHIKYVQLPNDTGKQHDLYVTDFSAGGSDYDIFTGDCIWPAEFSNAGYVLPIDRFLTKDNINVNDYLPGAINECKFKGEQWAMPLYVDFPLLFYRTDYVSSAPKTWDDLIKAAKSAKAKGASMGYVAQGKQYEGMVCDAIDFIGSYGGTVVDGNGNITIKSNATVQALTEMKKVYTDSGIAPSNINTFEETETNNAFTGGEAALARNWTYMYSNCKLPSSKVANKFAFAELPMGTKHSACLGGWTVMINANSKHPNEAWEFEKWLTGKEGQKTMAIVGANSPSLKSTYSDPDVLKANPFFGEEAYKDTANNAISRPVSPYYSKLSEIMQIQLSKMLGNQISVTTCVNNMYNEMETEIKTESTKK